MSDYKWSLDFIVWLIPFCKIGKSSIEGNRQFNKTARVKSCVKTPAQNVWKSDIWQHLLAIDATLWRTHCGNSAYFVNSLSPSTKILWPGIVFCKFKVEASGVERRRRFLFLHALFRRERREVVANTDDSIFSVKHCLCDAVYARWRLKHADYLFFLLWFHQHWRVSVVLFREAVIK